MNKLKLIIITGSSSGLGLELVKICQKWPATVIWTISRNKPPGLANNSRHFKCDLSKEKDTTRLLSRLQAEVLKLNIADIVLINNAAIVSPIGYIGEFDSQDIQSHLHLNLTTPALLSNFVFQQKILNKSVINVSSGAAHFPIANWSLYCSAKAGLLMMQKCIQLEINKKHERILSFSPGLIDTNMQAQIRSTKVHNMKDVSRFKKYKKDGLLRSPQIVAQALSKLIANPKKFKKAEYEIQDLLS